MKVWLIKCTSKGGIGSGTTSLFFTGDKKSPWSVEHGRFFTRESQARKAMDWICEYHGLMDAEIVEMTMGVVEPVGEIGGYPHDGLGF